MFKCMSTNVKFEEVCEFATYHIWDETWLKWVQVYKKMLSFFVTYIYVPLINIGSKYLIKCLISIYLI